MDHLPLPKNVSLTDKVPFLGSRHDETTPFLHHEKTPFLQYHKILSVPSTELLENFFSTLIKDGKLSTTAISLYATQIHVAEKALQAWLFFGILKEFLGSSYDHKEFLDAEYRMLSTKNLVQRVDEWIEQRSNSVNAEELAHLDKCIRFVYYAIWVFWKPENNLILKLSIASVAEVLHGAVRKVGGNSSALEPLSWVVFWDENDTINRLIRANWCKYEASQVPKRLMSLSTRYFYTHLTRENSGRVHSFCDGTICYAASIQVERQRDPRIGTPHRHSDCSCEEIAISQHAQIKANSILKNGQFPVFLVRASDAGTSIDVTTYKEATQFVAISHVFADGLGNEKRNAMKSCQLLHLSNLLKTLWKRELANEKDHDVWFWIDTFGCPRADLDARNLSIMRLGETFKKASHVLVLDSELQTLTCAGMDELEISARVLNSGWMHRLWTLSENSVSRSVWIQFNDCAKNLIDHLATGVETIFKREGVKYFAVAKDVISHLQGLQGLCEDYPNLKVQLFDISSAMEFRLTTRPSDEPLCIGMLVDLDLGALQLVKDEIERKKLLWELLAQKYIIPRTIVFYEGPVLPCMGFQWAPRSLGSPGLRSVLMNAEKKQAKLETTAKPKGLHASFPGGKISMPLPNELDPNKLQYLEGEPSNLFPIRLVSASKRWILLSRDDSSSQGRSLLDLFQNRNGSFAIIRDPDNLSLGQLAEVGEIINGVQVVKRLFNVNVRNHESLWNALLEMVLGEAQNLFHSAVVQRVLSGSGPTDENDNDPLENVDSLEDPYTNLNNAIRETAVRMFASCGQMSPHENDLTFVCAALSGTLVGRYGTIEEVASDGSLPNKRWCFV